MIKLWFALSFFVMAGAPASALEYGQEYRSGTTKVIWLQHETVPQQGESPRQALWINLHSDDPDTATFHVLIRYRASNGRNMSVKRDIPNDAATEGSLGYWVSDPNTCVFWIGWPSEVSFAVSEEKRATDWVDLGTAK